jgi:glucose/arabinose dehydrogenase
MRTVLVSIAVSVALAVLGGATSQAAATLPAGFTDTLVASVTSPTSIAFTPDGRLLVTTQTGAVRIIQNGSLLAQPALDLGTAVCTTDEMGLLGITPDPAFASNGFVYAYYTRNKSGTCVNRVSRFTLSGNTISPSSELVLVDEIPAPGGNHNAGDVQFGKDGLLYASVGDGYCDYAGNSGCGHANDAARDQNVLVGKILRITSTGGIPASNPFQGAGTARCNVTGRTSAGNKCQETFAWGLRNPFRIAFDSNAAGTRFYINDVGQSTWEEVDNGVAGADYGWSDREGPCANGSDTNCGPPPAGMTNPIYWYSHAESTCNAITGGAFVPNGLWPSTYDNGYLYTDYTCGKIFLLKSNGSGGFTRSEFASAAGAVVNVRFGPSPVGQALYYTNYDNGGEIHRIAFTGAGNRAPTARVTATPTSGPAPLTVNFDGTGSSDPDAGDTLTYVWDWGDGTPGATTSTPTTSHRYATSGSFTASLTVRDNKGASSLPVTVRIDPGNTAPQVTIDTPTASTQFAVGQTITLHGTASDAQDGSLPASSLSWVVIRHHAAHTHPFLPATTGNDVQITGPTPEDLLAASNSYLEIQLTATDSRGLTTTVTRDLLPRKVDLTFGANPSGLKVELTGISYTTPSTVTSWEGYDVGVNAPAQVDGSGTSWTFQSWSDGGAASHTIKTPAAAASYTARFVQAPSGPSGLVAAYGFNEGVGSSVGDASGNGNGGVVSGAAWNTGGKFGGALSFDGVNDWVTIADAASLDLTTGMTLETWVSPSALNGSWRTALMKERTGGMCYALYAHTGTLGPSAHIDAGGLEPRARSSSLLASGVWSHLAATYDGSAIRLYVNGVLAVTQAASGSVTSSTGALRIGGNSVWNEWFAGLIDEVRVYNRALTAGEIQTDMQKPVGTGPPPPPPPPPSDTAPPTAPGSLTASVASGSISLNWTASTDNVGVTRYDVYRGTTSGFTPSTANRIAQPTSTTYTDPGLAPGTYYYRVAAEDAAGNVSAFSNEASATIAAPAAGLVAAYGFNETVGSSAGDASGKGNGGVVSGAAWNTAGKFGGALSFDGVNDWVTVADSASLRVATGLTLEAWVKPSALNGSWQTVLLKERTGGLCYALYAHTGALGPSAHVDVGSSEPRARSSSLLSGGVWTHLAATYDGTAVRLYVNGVLAVSQAASGAVTSSTGALRIGGNSVWSEWFAGLIDEVRVYSRALAAGEIQTDMQTPVR